MRMCNKKEKALSMKNFYHENQRAKCFVVRLTGFLQFRKHETVRFFHISKANECFVNMKNSFGEPEKVNRRKVWENILKMGKEATQSMRVCSLHVCKEDFFLPGEYNYFMNKLNSKN